MVLRSFIGFFLLIGVSACSASGAATPAGLPVTETTLEIPIPSEWAGGIMHTDGTVDSILLRLTDSGGTLSIQPHSNALTLSDIAIHEASLSFRASGEMEMRFTGMLDGSQISGEVQEGNQTGRFVLLPIDKVSYSDFEGTYQFDSGSAVRVHLSPGFSASGLDFFPEGLSITHFGTGEVRGLYPLEQDTFFVGSARVLGYPFEAQITFRRDAAGNVDGLTWRARDAATGELGEAETGTRLALQTETVQYSSEDGVMLTGLLTVPPTPGPHPGMVVLHGSERGTRDDFFRQQLSAFLASRGFVVLTFDKRGVGDSGGVYREAASQSNLSLLAQDALAGVTYLKSRPEVDGAHIGLIGSSQAGWVIPLAAAQSDDVDFFVMLSGPLVSVGVEDAYSTYTNDGESASQYTAAQISEKLASIQPSGFDPLPVLAAIDQPGLWLWGSVDKSIPVPESAKNLDGLIAQGRTGFSYHIFPDADHNLQQSRQGLFTEIPYSSGYPEDLFPILGEWLQEQIQ